MTAREVARFGLLVALSLVLGYLDRSIPMTWFLSGAIPGIKLGLANTVLLYGVYLMGWRQCVLLMLVKVLLSGFLFGSLSAILYSLCGGALSLLVMLLIRRNPALGAVSIAGLAAVSDGVLLWRNPSPRGEMLRCVILIALACAAGIAVFFWIRRRPDSAVLGVSLAGAVAHNVGQILAAGVMMRTPQLLSTYLPVLVGVGAAVGCLTGLVARLVFRALHIGTEGV